MLWKWRWLKIIHRFLKEELQSNQVKIPFMNWLFEKVNLFVLNIKLHSSDQGIFDCNLLVYNEMENILMDKISI